jgi:lauroyl/myristoyl acyltransferase
MRFLPALFADGAAPAEAEIVRVTAELTRRIEAQITEAPDQWWWLHNRWKRREEGLAAVGDRLVATSTDRS